MLGLNICVNEGNEASNEEADATADFDISSSMIIQVFIFEEDIFGEY